jgi:hypothetical protein
MASGVTLTSMAPAAGNVVFWHRFLVFGSVCRGLVPLLAYQQRVRRLSCRTLLWALALGVNTYKVPITGLVLTYFVCAT